MPLQVQARTSLTGTECRIGLQNTYLGEALWLFFVLLVLLMLGRAAFVFPISFMHNLWSREKLAVREMIVIWCTHLSTLPWDLAYAET